MHTHAIAINGTMATTAIAMDKERALRGQTTNAKATPSSDATLARHSSIGSNLGPTIAGLRASFAQPQQNRPSRCASARSQSDKAMRSPSTNTGHVPRATLPGHPRSPRQLERGGHVPTVAPLAGCCCRLESQRSVDPLSDNIDETHSESEANSTMINVAVEWRSCLAWLPTS